MSTTISPADYAPADDNAFTATLIRGRVFYLGEKEFALGVAVPVSAAVKAYLSLHAVDQASVEGEGNFLTLPKFAFEPVGEAAATPARTRTR